MFSWPTCFGGLRVMSELLVLGFLIGFTLCTCVYFTGYALAQVQSLVRHIR